MFSFGSLFTLKTKILVTLYASYIWDAVRDDYVESCRKEYLKYYDKLAAMQRKRSRSGSRYYRAPPSQDLNDDDYRCSLEDDDLASSQINHGEFNCPLPAMPRLVRVYQIFSSAFVVYSTIKYAIISVIHYRWLNIDPVYACYLPGRLCFTPGIAHDVPWFGFMIFGYHVIWRYMWMFSSDRLRLNSFLFLLCSQDTVAEIESKLCGRDSLQPILPEATSSTYFRKRLFYEQQRTRPNSNWYGRNVYVMKANRTVEHYEKLKKDNLKFLLTFALNILPVVTWCYFGFTSQFDHDYFKLNYPSCESFSHSDGSRSATFQWSFEDRFRLSYLLFDLLDNCMMLFDTTIAMIFPFVAALILCDDLAIRLDILNKRMSGFNNSLRLLSFSNDDDNRVTSTVLRALEHNQVAKEAELLFNETMSTFEQATDVDKFMGRFNSFLIYVWFSLTMSMQILLFTRLHLLNRNIIIFYILCEIYLHVGMSTTLFLMTRPHQRSRVLYTRICSAMALCPYNPRTRMISWPWLLEYYHSRSSRYSLHLVAGYHTLSRLNILRCLSWFISCTLVMIHLIKRKLSISVWKYI